MATSFKGWGNSWGNSWGPISTDPNDMSGAAGIALTATATATAALFGSGAAGFSFGATGVLEDGAAPSDGFMVGAAAFTFSAIGILTDPNAIPPQSNTDQGVAGKNKPAERNWYVERLNAEFARKSRIERENKLATAFIMALLQTEILDG